MDRWVVSRRVDTLWMTLLLFAATGFLAVIVFSVYGEIELESNAAAVQVGVKQMTAETDRTAAKIQALSKYIAELDSMSTAGEAVCSWYGPGFHGKKTASGIVYDQYSRQMAHRTLPYGTVVVLTNPKTGAQSWGIITDRGPFHKNPKGEYDRDYDLSDKCAQEAGMKHHGVVLLKTLVLRRKRG